MNRCDVRALQRKDLERTSKEKPCSLQTVGYGWAEKGGACGGKGLLWRAIWKGWCKRKAFGLLKWEIFEDTKQGLCKRKAFVRKKAAFECI